MATNPADLARRFAASRVSAYLSGSVLPLASRRASGFSTVELEFRALSTADAGAVEKALVHYAQLVEAIGFMPAWEPVAPEVKP